jgi:hypothetical protein
MKITSPIIEEIHAFRAQYARQYGYDLKVICNGVRLLHRYANNNGLNWAS